MKASMPEQTSYKDNEYNAGYTLPAHADLRDTILRLKLEGNGIREIEEITGSSRPFIRGVLDSMET
jgi:hypothetical protein